MAKDFFAPVLSLLRRSVIGSNRSTLRYPCARIGGET
jgi:hypothetical protein